ncbi:hypothetical protein ACH4Q6_35515 [Streptomyces lydicus]|uniref:hypothetical protein n=1 Tax=Streptomyces lydicus TaxID=47763 RepID=UPI003796ACBF
MTTPQRLIRAALTAILAAGLSACGGTAAGHDDPAGPKGHGAAHGQTAPAAPGHSASVTGLRDGVRHFSPKTVRATRPHLVEKCTTGTKRVRHTKRNGRTKHTWYTTEHYRNCHKVRKGNESYRRLVRREKWCIRLDDVNGVKSEDARWFRVPRTVYTRALGTESHNRMTFTPLGRGC